MFHAIIEYCTRNATHPDEVSFVTLVEELKKAPSEGAAVRNVILERIRQLPTPSTTLAVRERLTALAELLLDPNYSSLYTTVAAYRETDDESPVHMMTVHDSLFKSKESASGDRQQIKWSNVAKLRSCYVDAIKQQGIAVSTLDVIVDIPFGKNSMKHIKWFDDTDRRECDFENLTHIGKSLFDRPAALWSPVRVYLSPSVAAHLSNELRTAVRTIAEASYHKPPQDGGAAVIDD